MIIEQYLDRAKPAFFCSCEMQGCPEPFEVQNRPKQEFSNILAKLDFKKLSCECGDLNDVINCLDDIWAGFDMLAVNADKIDRALMLNAVNALERSKILPQNADKYSVMTAVKSYLKLDSHLQAIMPELVVCICKLCFYICKDIRRSAQEHSGIVINSDD